MAGYIDVNQAVKDAEELLNRKEELFEEIDAVRTALRGAIKSKSVTADQEKWIKEQFPEKSKRSKAERKADLEKKLKETNEAKR